jgi:hypothetical protein
MLIVGSACNAGKLAGSDVLQTIAKTCGIKPDRLSFDKNGSARLNGTDISYKQAMCVFRELDKKHVSYPKGYVGKIS